MSLTSYKVDAFDDMMPGMFGANYDVFQSVGCDDHNIHNSTSMYGSFDAVPNGGGIHPSMHSSSVPQSLHPHLHHTHTGGVVVPPLDVAAMDFFAGVVAGSNGEATSDSGLSEEYDSLDSPISPRSVASHPASPRTPSTVNVNGGVGVNGGNMRSAMVSMANHQNGVAVEDSAPMATFVSWDGYASESTHAAFPSTFRSASPGLLDAHLAGLAPVPSSFPLTSRSTYNSSVAAATAAGLLASSDDTTDNSVDSSAPSSPSSPSSPNSKKRKLNFVTPRSQQQQHAHQSSFGGLLSSAMPLPMPGSVYATANKRVKQEETSFADDAAALPFNMNAYWMLMQQQQQQPQSPLQMQLQLQMQMQLLRASALAAAQRQQDAFAPYPAALDPAMAFAPIAMHPHHQHNHVHHQSSSSSNSFHQHAKAAAAAAALADRERRVRPKVVPEKGAIQCQGFNRKKNVQCRNAALMEFIGPRPQYCAEHIDLDPSCMYTKCRSEFHKIKGDGKGCREVVLKEFSFCHKHYTQSTDRMSGSEGFAVAAQQLARVAVLLTRLEGEAAQAKKHDPDLFQRKHKLIPKFQQMYKVLEKRLGELIADGFGSQAEINAYVTEAQNQAAAQEAAAAASDSNGSSLTTSPASSMPASPAPSSMFETAHQVEMPSVL